MQKYVPLNGCSTFKIGGLADYFCEIKSTEDINQLTDFLVKHPELPRVFLGSGSNLIFSDDGFRGIVIRLVANNIFLKNNLIKVEAGVLNANIYRFALKYGLDYSPWLTIPGTLGGAIAGNAGIPHHEISDILQTASILDLKTNKVREVDATWFKFAYRHSIFHQRPELRQRILILNATLKLPQAEPETIKTNAEQLMANRKAKQPWGKTGGSFFKNPKNGQAAGYLLDQAGCKDLEVGDAYFSPKHANFLMNAGNATQSDVIKLAQLAQQKVLAKFGVKLENEVILLNQLGEIIKL